MGRIPEATIQEIRHRADIVALVSRYVELKQAGRNWKGLCPFHNEKTPSFNVNPQLNGDFWKLFNDVILAAFACGTSRIAVPAVITSSITSTRPARGETCAHPSSLGVRFQ